MHGRITGTVAYADRRGHGSVHAAGTGAAPLTSSGGFMRVSMSIELIHQSV